MLNVNALHILKLSILLNVLAVVFYYYSEYTINNVIQQDEVTYEKLSDESSTLNEVVPKINDLENGEYIIIQNKDKWTKDFQVPNIVHYNWFATEDIEFKYHHMLSIMSSLKYIKPIEVKFHCNREPVGKYWERAKKLKGFKVYPRKNPDYVFGIKVKEPKFYTSYSNVDRLLILYEQGGIYLDLDVLATQSFDDLRHYVHTVGLEVSDKVCGSIIVSSNTSVFLHFWMKMYIDDYQIGHWAYNSGQVPYDLSVRYPDIVNVEKTKLNRPNYMELDKLLSPTAFDWRQNYAVHIWHRFWKGSTYDHKVEPDDETIKTWKGAFGEMARAIIYGKSDIIS